MKNKFIVLAVAIFCAAQAVPAQTVGHITSRGVGPFTVQTKRGPVIVQLLRRENDLIWYDQKTASGRFIEAGIDVKDITHFDIPHFKIFDIALTAKTAEQISQMLLSLKKVSDPLKPYRDLPGMVVDEALFLQAQLLEKSGRWREALTLYEDIANQTYKPKEASLSQLRAGRCLVQLQQYEKALEHLSAQPIPDDDLNVLSDLYFARAQSRAALGQHDEAIMDYLRLVVFYPFVQTNEARALSAVLPSYAAIKDWDATWKTLDTLRKQYPDSDATKEAEAFVKKFEKELGQEVQYHDTDEGKSKE